MKSCTTTTSSTNPPENWDKLQGFSFKECTSVPDVFASRRGCGHFLFTKAAAISTLFDFSRGVADKLAARKTMTQMVDFCFSIWVPKNL